MKSPKYEPIIIAGEKPPAVGPPDDMSPHRDELIVAPYPGLMRKGAAVVGQRGEGVCLDEFWVLTFPAVDRKVDTTRYVQAGSSRKFYVDCRHAAGRNAVASWVLEQVFPTPAVPIDSTAPQVFLDEGALVVSGVGPACAGELDVVFVAEAGGPACDELCGCVVVISDLVNLDLAGGVGGRLPDGSSLTVALALVRVAMALGTNAWRRL